MSVVKCLKASQKLPITVEEAWSFYSNPHNLKVITPPELDFNIISHEPPAMEAGSIIRYTVRPLFGVAVTWVTEIKNVRPPHYFVDEQRIGPYKMWHHQHIITPIDNGVEVEDIVHYAIPGGIFTAWMDPFLIKPRLDHIFKYRRQILQERFGDLI